MNAVLFVTDELLLESHKKLVTVPGHVRRGRWIDPYQMNVLVSDDHDTDKVASGQGSFYQKQAHKKLSGKVEGFATMNPDAKATLVLAHATKLQDAASAAAALSNWKKEAFAGKNPKPAMWAAFYAQDADGKKALLAQVEAKAGQLDHLHAPSNPSLQPPGETHGVKANQTVQGQSKTQADKELNALASGPGGSQTVSTAPGGDDSLPKGWKKEGAFYEFKSASGSKFTPTQIAGVVGGTVTKHGMHSVIGVPYHAWEAAKSKLKSAGMWSDGPTATPLHTFTGDGLEAYVSAGTGPNKGKFGVSLKDTDAGEFVPTVNFYPTEREAVSAAKGAAGVGEHDDIEASLYKQPATVTLGGHMADPDITGYSVPEMKAKWLKYNPGKEAEWAAAEVSHNVGDPWAAEKMQEGATKTENGKTYVLHGGRWHFDAPDDSDNHKAAVAAMETGAFYQKEAIKKLKAEHGAAWDAMHPSKQHELAHAKYQALQGAASQAAAVSGWKKHMLAGQVPSPSEVKAVSALSDQDFNKATNLMKEVQAKIGLDKYVHLVTQAHAKAAKAPATAPAPANAKVFVTKPIPGNVTMEPAKPVPHDVKHLSSYPAYDFMANKKKNYGSHALPSQNNFLKMAAQDWLAANPTKEAEMHEALASLKLTHLTDKIGMLTKPGEKPSAPSNKDNAAYQKLADKPLAQQFILTFKLHGNSSLTAGMNPADVLEPDEIAAFQALSPDQKLDVAAAISFYGPHKLKLFQDWLSDQNVKAATPVNVSVPADVYKNTTAGHNKFWSVSTHGNVMKTTYGKIGTNGSETSKEFGSPDAAEMAAAKLKNEKMGKGYKYANTGVHQYDANSAGNQPAPTAPKASTGVPPAVKDEFDKLAAQGNFQTLQEILDVGGLKPEVQSYLWSLLSNGPKDGTVVHPFDDKRYKKPAKWSAMGSHGVTAPQYGFPGAKPGYGGGAGYGGHQSSLFSGPKPEPKAYHPKPGDKGQKVGIYNPHVPAVAGLSDPGAVATITPGCEMPESLNGIAFTSWTPPAEDDWDFVDGQMDDLDEPVLHVPKGKEAASGLVIVEPDGRAWVVSPTNRFGGYKNTFPKGKVEPELSFQSNAIKEAWEEGGIKANIIGLLGDVERTTSVTRYYLARRVAGNPAGMGWESQGVHLCPISKLVEFLDSQIDHKVVDLLSQG